MPNLPAQDCIRVQPSLAEVSGDKLRAELELALDVLHDMERAKRAVAEAVLELPGSFAAQADNRRDRYTPKNGRRSATKLLLEGDFLLRFHVLDQVEIEELEQETAMLLSNSDWVKRTTKKHVKTVLNRPSFFATLLMAEIFCGFTGPQTLQFYDELSGDGSASKDTTSCTKAKKLILNKAKDRFGPLLTIQKISSQYLILSEKASSEQADQVEHDLVAFLPQPSTPLQRTRAFISKSVNLLSMRREQTAGEIAAIQRILMPAEFNKLIARHCSSTFRQRLLLPKKSDPSSDGPMNKNTPNGGTPSTSGGSVSSADVQDLIDRISRKHRRRSRVCPGSLRFSVDGHRTIDVTQCCMLLDETVDILRLIGTDDEGQRVTLASHVLIHDAPRFEVWDVDLGEAGSLAIHLCYNEDGEISVTWSIDALDSSLVTNFSRECLFYPLRPDLCWFDESRPDMDFWGPLASLPSNDYILVVGASGAGKSSLCGALLRTFVDSCADATVKFDVQRVTAYRRFGESAYTEAHCYSEKCSFTLIDSSGRNLDASHLGTASKAFGVFDVHDWHYDEVDYFVRAFRYQEIPQVSIVLNKADLSGDIGNCAPMIRETERILKIYGYIDASVLCISATNILNRSGSSWDLEQSRRILAESLFGKSSLDIFRFARNALERMFIASADYGLLPETFLAMSIDSLVMKQIRLTRSLLTRHKDLTCDTCLMYTCKAIENCTLLSALKPIALMVRKHTAKRLIHLENEIQIRQWMYWINNEQRSLPNDRSPPQDESK